MTQDEINALVFHKLQVISVMTTLVAQRVGVMSEDFQAAVKDDNEALILHQFEKSLAKDGEQRA